MGLGNREKIAVGKKSFSSSSSLLHHWPIGYALKAKVGAHAPPPPGPAFFFLSFSFLFVVDTRKARPRRDELGRKKEKRLPLCRHHQPGNNKAPPETSGCRTVKRPGEKAKQRQRATCYRAGLPSILDSSLTIFNRSSITGLGVLSQDSPFQTRFSPVFFDTCQPVRTTRWQERQRARLSPERRKRKTPFSCLPKQRAKPRSVAVRLPTRRRAPHRSSFPRFPSYLSSHKGRRKKNENSPPSFSPYSTLHKLLPDDEEAFASLTAVRLS